MKYQVTFTAQWNKVIEADSREEANKILARDWEELSYGIDGSAMNLEADLEEEGYDE
jgi:hypothetical protein